MPSLKAISNIVSPDDLMFSFKYCKQEKEIFFNTSFKIFTKDSVNMRKDKKNNFK